MSEQVQLSGTSRAAEPQPEPLVDPQLQLATQTTEPQSQQDSQDLLAQFPRKRRGRPPGRPNTTVRDADYQSNPAVQLWNAAKVDVPIAAVAVNIREALTEASLVHDTQRAIFRLPCREYIYFVHGWITAKHIASQRPSYVNGFLIHSRGEDSPTSCVQCVDRRAKNALGPFLTCRTLPGSFHNSCSNCKWFDNTSSCSLYTGPKPNRKRKAREMVDSDLNGPAVASPDEQNATNAGANAAVDVNVEVDAQEVNAAAEAHEINAQNQQMNGG